MKSETESIIDEMLTHYLAHGFNHETARELTVQDVMKIIRAQEWSMY